MISGFLNIYPSRIPVRDFLLVDWVLLVRVLGMLSMLQDLVHHKGYANACLIRAVRHDERAAQDREIRELLHHIVLANRFWLFLILGRLFAKEEESRIPESINEIVAQYQETHTQELQWLAQAREESLALILETPFIPGRSFTVSQALIQVCMHSHGHRSQCATRLRILGGAPPAMDFILWLKERPAADWT